MPKRLPKECKECIEDLHAPKKKDKKLTEQLFQDFRDVWDDGKRTAGFWKAMNSYFHGCYEVGMNAEQERILAGLEIVKTARDYARDRGERRASKWMTKTIEEIEKLIRGEKYVEKGKKETSCD